MNLSGLILRIFGWRVEITAPRHEKCVICVAPHTSNWDFPLGLLAYRSLGRRANFLMKESWFFFPLGFIFRSLGGIPVKRTKSTMLTDYLIDKMQESNYMNLAVTPEGTRSRADKWRTGFMRVAQGTGVPVQLGVIDYATHTIYIKEEIYPSPDIEADMLMVKTFYAPLSSAAKYPEKFST